MMDDGDDRDAELRSKRICRMCLTTEAPLTDLYSNENRLKSRVPLPLQIMACVSLEVFTNDGLPRTICDPCRLIIDYCYRFKQICRKSDTLLKQFPLTGVWSDKIPLPVYPPELVKLVKPNLTALKRKPSGPYVNESAKRQHLAATAAAAADADVEPILLNVQSTPPKAQQAGKVRISPNGSIKTTAVLGAEPHLKRKTPVVLHNRSATVVALTPLGRKPAAPPGKPRILNSSAKSSTLPKAPALKHNDDGNLELILDQHSLAETSPNADNGDNDDGGGDGASATTATVERDCFPCDQCKRTFPLQQMLDMHMERHTRDRVAECEVCHKRFFTKYDLSKHALVHTGEKRFMCAVCPRGFSRANLLERHEQTHKDAFRHSCGYCQKQFVSREELLRHEERHKIVRKFQCKHCDKSFAFKQGLDRHEVIHSKNQPFPCSYCDVGFSTSTKLARHLTEHAGSRPYPCRMCSKSFLMTHHLDRHMRSHKNASGGGGLGHRTRGASGVGGVGVSGGGNGDGDGGDVDGEMDIGLECMACDQAFVAYADLMEHSEQHAMESGVCPFCKMMLGEEQEIVEHMRQHADQQYACEFCDLMFAQEEHKEEHCQLEHADEQEMYANDARARADAVGSGGGGGGGSTPTNVMVVYTETSDVQQAGEEILHELIIPSEGGEEVEMEEHAIEDEEQEMEEDEEEQDQEPERVAVKPARTLPAKSLPAKRRTRGACLADENAQQKILNYMKKVEPQEEDEPEDEKEDAADDEGYDAANIEDMEFEYIDIIKSAENSPKRPQSQQTTAKRTQAKPTMLSSNNTPTKKIPVAQLKVDQHLLTNLKKSPASKEQVGGAKSPAVLTKVNVKTLPSGVTLKKVQLNRPAVPPQVVVTRKSAASSGEASPTAEMVKREKLTPVANRPQLRRVEVPAAAAASPTPSGAVRNKVGTASPATTASAAAIPQKSGAAPAGRSSVQRVRMTQSQVDAMAREGKIQVKDGQVFLRQKN